MRYLEINKTNLKNFINDIRIEDKKELIYFFKNEYKNEFIKICLKNKENIIFLANEKNIPIAIGGVVEIIIDNSKIAQIWLICANSYKNNKLILFKTVYKYLKNYIKKYDFLFNYVYKTNFSADLWLKKFGFKFVDTKNKNFKLFYLNKGEKRFDIRYFTGK